MAGMLADRTHSLAHVDRIRRGYRCAAIAPAAEVLKEPPMERFESAFIFEASKAGPVAIVSQGGRRNCCRGKWRSH
jgi:hypothetical protein